MQSTYQRTFLAALICLSLPLSALALTPAELASKLQSQYDKTQDMRAEFTQVSVVKAMNMTREGSGELVIKKPGRLRYTYKKPEKQTILVKDGQLIMHMPSSNQVVMRKLERAVMDKTPTTFLAGLGRITDSFDVSYPKSGQSDADGNLVLRLTPRGDRMNIEYIDLTVGPKDYDIRGFSFRELSGNTNAIRLKAIRTNKGVDDSEFMFEIPKGARLITE